MRTATDLLLLLLGAALPTRGAEEVYFGGSADEPGNPEVYHRGGGCNGQPEGKRVGGRVCAGKLLKKCPPGKRCEGERRKKKVRETKVVEEGLDGFGKRIMRETVVTEYEVKDLPKDRTSQVEGLTPRGVTYYGGTTYPVVDGFTLTETAGGLQYVPHDRGVYGSPQYFAEAPGVYGAPYGVPQYAAQPRDPSMYGAPQYVAQPESAGVYSGPQYAAQPPPVQYVAQPPPQLQPPGLDYMQPPPTYRLGDYVPAAPYTPSYYDRRPYDEPEAPNYGLFQPHYDLEAPRSESRLAKCAGIPGV